MNRYTLLTFIMAAVFGSAIAQDFTPENSSTESDSSIQQESKTSFSEQPSLPAVTNDDPQLGAKKSSNIISTIISPLKLSATVDMQVEKKMYDEFSASGDNRFYMPEVRGLRKVADDFWLRVALRASYQLQFFESAFALRFYPYWTMRRIGAFPDGKDLQRYYDVIEINQAYLKGFKDYSYGDRFKANVHLKIGRDGLLNSCSQLFGNYLDQPTGGYGDSRYDNITGPFKNRKIFANQLEAGLTLNFGSIITSKTSIMVGNNLNNEKWYGAPQPTLFQQLDSKLSAGFVRGYQDFYILNDRFHVGTGFRNYSTTVDSSGVLIVNNYLFGQCEFDVTIIPDFKFYAEIAYQRLGCESSTGIVRPINIGITFPTGKMLDVLALEFENVAKTFFSDESMRDAIGGRNPTVALAWGIVAEKRFVDRVSIAWGLYSGNPTGDMKTTLRLTSDF